MALQGFVALRKGDFTLNTGEFVLPDQGVSVIFGHSGSGKTTFLRALAGFEKQLKGEVWWRDECWQRNQKRVPIHKRRLGFVFQEASLFAHLTVLQNLKYGQKRAAKRQSHPPQIRFEDVTEQLGLHMLLDRSVANLSGGERQRVAIGRALLSQPQLLMMDEPLSALDLQAKIQILPYIERLRDWLKIPILYITHSPEEVERLADYVVWMKLGRIEYIDTLEQALTKSDTPLFQNEAPRCVLSAKVLSHVEEEGLTQVQAGQAQLWIPQIVGLKNEPVRVIIPAKNVSLVAQKPKRTSILNHLPVEITAIEPFDASSLRVHLKVNQEPWPLLALITKRSVKELDLGVGQQWVAAIKTALISQ